MNKTQPQHQRHADLDLPETLDTADAKLVYLYLRIENEATIDELHTALGMKKITLYSLLQILTATDHVDRTGTQYVCQPQTTTGGNL
ncbi:hypothetical protein HAPAU_32740 [Halalkalicoccus paucihalophilus]|uniref:Sugar-specific transcriptional regulator TrmB n=1 Tax=Halalkalicoccus paucihalophilus TaxID=1008153 RepID=A0A151A9D6_9EURY|nr:hypothetical protein [Halalkalicoccus paucihalophilus]KYH24291.1 hypothetical protein HAPAU_32740 [Halalkalicoccus paucihalophilus]